METDFNLDFEKKVLFYKKSIYYIFLKLKFIQQTISICIYRVFRKFGDWLFRALTPQLGVVWARLVTHIGDEWMSKVDQGKNRCVQKPKKTTFLIKKIFYFFSKRLMPGLSEHPVCAPDGGKPMYVIHICLRAQK